MNAATLKIMINATYDYFVKLGDWHKDEAGVEAVMKVKDQMVADVEAIDGKAGKDELEECCRRWRAMRIEFGEEAVYPPDMFIESVCQVIEIS